MTERPVNVQIAQPEHEDRLYQLLLHLYDENAMFVKCPIKIRDTLRQATERKGGMIGFIEDGKKMVATIGVFMGSFWYSDDWYLDEYWNFVHPEHRHSSYANDLIAFAKWFSEQMGFPLHMGIHSTERTEAKVRLYRRKLTPIGAVFAHNLHIREAAHG